MSGNIRKEIVADIKATDSIVDDYQRVVAIKAILNKIFAHQELFENPRLNDIIRRKVREYCSNPVYGKHFATYQTYLARN
ncbi:hypothetical protein BNJ_00023 [Kaumoebavirus]|uniref:hypothetical protein n=1 Tax=Kaumoebavirus TaxID=1859492 RepID=UPI0009C271F2|nr:hypothetical protein BNJ_00023 [Kaumoebavirus]ARA71866.1 hypothetical protein BNJ_00023 [Kaumoebavirus]